jgi:hypothetical protein
MQPEDQLAKGRANSGGPRGGLRLLTADELDGLPDPRWLVDGILPERAIAVLYGQPGIGKSFLALDWAFSIAAGRP